MMKLFRIAYLLLALALLPLHAMGMATGVLSGSTCSPPSGVCPAHVDKDKADTLHGMAKTGADCCSPQLTALPAMPVLAGTAVLTPRLAHEPPPLLERTIAPPERPPRI
ncbi:hypothetical protein [Crenobacter cavernae]|uniref:DUF2946 domain-containing protein n=1 Tax=Crenobacter cavernae TaxID=2290923 RepID=A0A345Y422_9NEIS|nr:hypothetical protein [Crenobacter cavernae]AXK38674.1 hypothetical protein DWG20_04095 [Crenobacter cavernae]